MQSVSKHFRPFFTLFVAGLVLFELNSKSSAQDIEAEFQLDPENSILHVDGKYLNHQAVGSQLLTFLSDYAGIRLPADRITNLKQLGNSWSYDVNLAPMKDAAAAAHISWLNSQRGVLMLADLLPVQPSSRTAAQIKLGLQTVTGWQRLETSTSDIHINADTISTQHAERSVFYLYSIPGERETRAANGSLKVIASSYWAHDEPSIFSTEISSQYVRLFGAKKAATVAVLFQAGNFPSGQWEADTRGANITIVSADPIFGSQSSQQLHEQLRHEMFHLWIPEGVKLTGNYDWFYEGFALYQSLKLGVAVNRLRFDDYLDTLSRAYDIDRRLGGKMSLIDASKNRWSGDNNTVVYSRGMLVALLCDLALLEASNGKRSTDDIVREVYRRHIGKAPGQDGNEAVIAILKSHKGLVSIVDDYVTGSKGLDWATAIRVAGLQATTAGETTRLAVVPKPGGSQKRLLDKLGYNNWRKLVSK